MTDFHNFWSRHHRQAYNIKLSKLTTLLNSFDMKIVMHVLLYKNFIFSCKIIWCKGFHEIGPREVSWQAFCLWLGDARQNKF